MAARKTTQELLAEIKKREQEIKDNDAKRRATRIAKLDEKDATLDERIAKLQDQKAANKTERDALNAEDAGFTSTPVDEV